LCHVCYEELNGEYVPEQSAPKPPTLTDAEETMLASMQHVSMRPESEDKTFQQEEMRKWMREDRKGFMGHRAALEAKYSTSRPGMTQDPGSRSNEPKDPARERVKLLLGKEFELVQFAQENRELILELLAQREGTSGGPPNAGDGDKSREAESKGL
jgi:hypothetical protein